MPELNRDISIPTPASAHTESDKDIVVVYREPVSKSGWPPLGIEIQAGPPLASMRGLMHVWSSGWEDLEIGQGIVILNPALTQENLVEREEELVMNLILSIKTSSNIYRGSRIAERLVFLENSLLEEEIDHIGINSESLQNYYDFLLFAYPLKLPAISISPQNNIYVSWEDASGNLFSLHFLPGRDVRFVIFKPNRRNPGKTIRVSGTTTTDMLIEDIMSYGVLSWITE